MITNKGYVTYVLRLEDGCWFIGKSNQLMTRLNKHLNGKAQRWTQIHKPISVAYLTNDDVEEELVNYAVKKYGAPNVRSSFVKKS